MFNLAIDSKLRGCDVVALKVEDAAPNGYAIDRATIRQPRTPRLIAYSWRRACRAVPRPAPCHSGETMNATCAADNLLVFARTDHAQKSDLGLVVHVTQRLQLPSDRAPRLPHPPIPAEL